MIGQMIESQGSYHRNSTEGEWNWPIDAGAGPDGKGEDFIDWNMWLGSQFKLAPKRPWDADRFFRFRKYWDYSLGIASDLFYHVIAPLNICWDEPQFPTKVMATGGVYVFKKLPDGKPDREVPDTFHLLAEYAKGHSLVLSSSMANDTHIPGMIRGHEGTIIMVEHGQFERNVPYITVKPQVKGGNKAIGGDGVREEVRREGHPDPGRPDGHDGRAHRQLPELHAHPRKTAPGRRDRRQGGGGHQPGGAVVPRRQDDVLGRSSTGRRPTSPSRRRTGPWPVEGGAARLRPFSVFEHRVPPLNTPSLRFPV